MPDEEKGDIMEEEVEEEVDPPSPRKMKMASVLMARPSLQLVCLAPLCNKRWPKQLLIALNRLKLNTAGDHVVETPPSVLLSMRLR